MTAATDRLLGYFCLQVFIVRKSVPSWSWKMVAEDPVPWMHSHFILCIFQESRQAEVNCSQVKARHQLEKYIEISYRGGTMLICADDTPRFVTLLFGL